jgi:hypothetical protein
MSDINKQTLFITGCSFLVLISQTVVAIHSFPHNRTNSSKQFQDSKINLTNQTINETFTTSDYDFFTYDVIDHRTLLVKFDITRTILFQQSQLLYDAHLYVSKIPSINYKINIGPFSGLYEKELDGTINDHFTFCLVLLPNRHQKKFNITLNTNKTETIYYDFLTVPYQEQQQHIIHYCTKMGPDEDRHRHHKKHGSGGDHILLLLQLMMIGIFLVGLQIAHIVRDRKYKEWRLRQVHRMRHEFVSRKEYANMPHDALEMLRFTSINNEEPQEEIAEHEEQKKEESLMLSHRQIPTSTKKRHKRRSLSPTIDPVHINPDDSSVEHILDTKPWLQIPH